jgi:hypothetical protein
VTILTRARELKAELGTKGVEVRLEGTTGLFITPRRLVTEDDLEALTASKDALLHILRLDQLLEAWWQADGPEFDLGCGSGLIRNPVFHVRDIHPQELHAFEALLSLTNPTELPGDKVA